MRACPESKAALELLTSRFEGQAAQPARRESRTFTEKHSFYVVHPQEREELSQMILRSLSRNILRRPSVFYWSLINISGKSKLEIELKYNIRGGEEDEKWNPNIGYFLIGFARTAYHLFSFYYMEA